MMVLSGLFGFSGLSAQSLHLNEIMASNSATISDEDGDYGDWIEIYNSGSEPIHLEGFGISDDYERPYRWTFPEISIDAGEFLLVWATNKDRRVPGSELHTNFAIASAGEEVILTAPDGTRLDELTPREIPTDISVGRFPDGTEDWYFFDKPTPGFPNTNEPLRGVLEEPALSHHPGFYTDEFDLEITHPEPGVTIRYTMDGSKPGNDSPVYSAPIRIRDRNSDPNDFSTIRTTYLSSWIGFSEPAESVKKGTPIRISIMKDGFEVYEGTYTFFVHPDGDHSHQLPVISIVSDRDNLFGHERGIFVPGINRRNDRDDTGNYMQRGIEWEREGSFEFFEENGELVISQTVGLRTHGGLSRLWPQKSIRVYARSMYGNNTIDYEIFGDPSHSSYKRLILRNSGTDFGKSMIRDGAAQMSIRHLNVDIQEYRPAIVYINGEYWGIQNIRERYDKHYLERMYGIDPDNIDLLTNKAEVREGDANDWLELEAFIDDNDLSLDENFEYIQTKIDLDNYLDYYTAQIFFRNTDWPHSNIDFWRSRVDYRPDAPPGYDGRWRWLLIDLDFTFRLNGLSHNFNMLEWVTREYDDQNRRWPNLVFRNLLENDHFRISFINRMADHLNGSFKPELPMNKIVEYSDAIRSEVPDVVQRWAPYRSVDRWESEIENMLMWASLRTEAVWSHMLDFFDLEERLPVELLANGPVILNSLQFEESDLPWTGDYFKGIPVTLEPGNIQGRVFQNWIINSQTISEHHITVLPDTINRVEAVFGDPVIEEPGNGESGEFRLYRNFPNPFQHQTIIVYDLPVNQHVRMDLYTIGGRHVRTVKDRQASAGTNSIMLNAAQLSSGIYIIRFRSENYSEVMKISLIK